MLANCLDNNAFDTAILETTDFQPGLKIIIMSAADRLKKVDDNMETNATCITVLGK